MQLDDYFSSTQRLLDLIGPPALKVLREAQRKLDLNMPAYLKINAAFQASNAINTVSVISAPLAIAKCFAAFKKI